MWDGCQGERVLFWLLLPLRLQVARSRCCHCCCRSLTVLLHVLMLPFAAAAASGSRPGCDGRLPKSAGLLGRGSGRVVCGQMNHGYTRDVVPKEDSLGVLQDSSSLSEMYVSALVQSKTLCYDIGQTPRVMGYEVGAP